MTVGLATSAGVDGLVALVVSVPALIFRRLVSEIRAADSKVRITCFVEREC